MRKFLAPLLCLIATAALYTFASGNFASGQTTSTPPIFALACANNTIVPTPTSGTFYLVQCNSSGQLLTNGLAATGGTLTGPLILPAGTLAAPSLTFGQAGTGYWAPASSQLAASQSGVLAFWLVSANSNAAFGTGAFNTTSTGTLDVAFGTGALTSNTTGTSDSAYGQNALYNNQTGIDNSAFGDGAIFTNVAGNYNSALGHGALYTTTGSQNVGVGVLSCFYVSSGSANTCIGYLTGSSISTGSNNTIIGANISGLASGLTGAIVLGTGDGVIHADWNNTTAAAWNLVGSNGATSAATGSIGEYTETSQPASGGGTSTFSGQPTAVINMANSFVPGNEVQFSTAPATGFSANTTYYVLAAGLTGSTYELSATANGTPITYTSNTTATTVTTIPLSSGATTSQNIAAAYLSAGDWDCSGNVSFVLGGADTATLETAWISTASATFPTFPNHGGVWQYNVTTGVAGAGSWTASLGRFRVLTASAVPVYLEAQATWATSTIGAYGDINCRRAR